MFIFNIDIGSDNHTFIVKETSTTEIPPSLLSLTENIRCIVAERLQCLIIPFSLQSLLTPENQTCSLDICNMVLQTAIQYYKSLRPLTNHEIEACQNLIETIQTLLHRQTSIFSQFIQIPPFVLSSEDEEASTSTTTQHSQRPNTSIDAKLKEEIALLEQICSNKGGSETEISQPAASTAPIWPLITNSFQCFLWEFHVIDFTTPWSVCIKKIQKKSHSTNPYSLYQSACYQLSNNYTQLNKLINSPDQDWSLHLLSDISPEFPKETNIINSDPRCLLVITSCLEQILESFVLLSKKSINEGRSKTHFSRIELLETSIKTWKQKYLNACSDINQEPHNLPITSYNPLLSDLQTNTLIPPFPNTLISASVLGNLLEINNNGHHHVIMCSFSHVNLTCSMLSMNIEVRTSTTTPYYLYQIFVRNIKNFLKSFPTLVPPLPSNILYIHPIFKLLVPQELKPFLNDHSHRALYYWCIAATVHYSLITLKALFQQVSIHPTTTASLSLDDLNIHCKNLRQCFEECKTRCEEEEEEIFEESFFEFPTVNFLSLMKSFLLIKTGSIRKRKTPSIQKSIEEEISTKSRRIETPASSSSVIQTLYSDKEENANTSDNEDTSELPPVPAVDIEAIIPISTTRQQSSSLSSSISTQVPVSSTTTIASKATPALFSLTFSGNTDRLISLSIDDILNRPAVDLTQMIGWKQDISSSTYNTFSFKKMPSSIELIQGSYQRHSKYHQLTRVNELLNDYLTQPPHLRVSFAYTSINLQITSTTFINDWNAFALLFAAKIIHQQLASLLHPNTQKRLLFETLLKTLEKKCRQLYQSALLEKEPTHP